MPALGAAVTAASNVLGTLNLLQSIVDYGLELEKFDTAGTSEEYGNPRESVAHHHDFDEEGGLILHERSPINPKSIYATSKVAADFLTMNYHDAFGVPGVVTRMFNNYGPRQNPRYVTGTIITQALEREWQLTGLRCDLAALQSLQVMLRKGEWKLTVAVPGGSHIVGLWPGLQEHIYGLAVDVGSTTIAGHLCDLESGEVVASGGLMNPQIRFGEDLMSRVSYSMMHPEGAAQMTEAVRAARGLSGPHE